MAGTCVCGEACRLLELVHVAGLTRGLAFAGSYTRVLLLESNLIG